MKNSLVVTKHNDLTESSYKLSLEEQRIILMCISKLNPTENNFSDKTITIYAKEYAEIYGIELRSTYQQLRYAASVLYNQDIVLRVENSNKVKGYRRWVQGIDYNHNEGSVTLIFSDYVFPYLGKLNGMFKSYQLNNIASLKSPYAIRLYELLNQWKSTGKRFINLDELNMMLKTTDIYERYTDLRRFVIEPAIAELNAKTNFSVSYKPKKKLRKVVALEFLFTVNASSKV